MMELALNLGWTAVAIALCWLCVDHARREGQERSAQVASLALVLFIMFAVITIYDDMAMAQNPAETCSFQREEKLGAHEHAVIHPLVASTPKLAAELPFNMFCFAVSVSLLVLTLKVPALSCIQNRPPPAA